jgi:sugar lactone lactonase YvrE
LLWWVDIFEGRVLRSSIDGGSTRRWELPNLVGAVAPTAVGGAAVACKEGFGKEEADGSVFALTGTGTQGMEQARFGGS